MKNFLFIASLAGAGLLVSCNHDRMADAPNVGDQAVVSYTVPVEEALAKLQYSLDAMQTRSSSRTVAGVETLFGSEVVGTRAADADAPLAYVANFEEGGYAILGADLRQDPVVAIVNENSMTPETLAAAKRAMDAGEEVDTPTYVNALVADYLVRSLAENQPQPRIGSWEIKEHKTPMLITKWGQNKHYGYGLNPATVAISQIFVYNRKFNRVGFLRLGGYTPNWSQLNTAATMVEPTGGCEEEVFKLCQVVDDTILLNLKGRSTIETVEDIIRRSMSSYKMVQMWDLSTGLDNQMILVTGRIRNMLYLNNFPIYMEGVSSSGNRHAWVVDGWQKQQMSGSTLSQYFLYCNFGQDGVGDGLYAFPSFQGYNNSLQFISYNFGD